MIQLVKDFGFAHPFYAYCIINFVFFVWANIARVKHYNKDRTYKKSIEKDLVANVLAGPLTILQLLAGVVLEIIAGLMRLCTAGAFVLARYRRLYMIFAFFTYIITASVIYYPMLLFSAFIGLFGPHSVEDLNPDLPKIKK